MFALNSALMADGVVIDIAKDASPAKPLHIVHVASGGAPAAAYTRSLLRVGANVSATLVESFFAADGAPAYQVNDATMIALGDGVRLDHVRLMEDGREAFNISTLKVLLGRNVDLQDLQPHQRRCGEPLSGAAALRWRRLARRNLRRQPLEQDPARRHRRWWSITRCRIAPAARCSAR